MTEKLESMLKQLEIDKSWLDNEIVDREFIEQCFAQLKTSLPEQVRTGFYSKFFSDRADNKVKDGDIAIYLNLVALEKDKVLKSWAIGFLVESQLLSVEQLKNLRSCSLLESKHKIFLEREINQLNSVQNENNVQ